MQEGAAVPNEGALMLAHMEVSHMVRALPPATCQTPLLTLIVAASAARRPFFCGPMECFATREAPLGPHFCGDCSCVRACFRFCACEPWPRSGPPTPGETQSFIHVSAGPGSIPGAESFGVGRVVRARGSREG